MIAALEAAGALLLLARVPHGSGGFSIARLTVLSLLGVIFGLWAYLALRPSPSLNALIRPAGAVGAALTALTCAVTLFLLRYLDPQSTAALYQRLGIFLWYLLAILVQLTIMLLILRFGFHGRALMAGATAWRPAALALGILWTAALFVAVAKVGLVPDTAYWGEPGVPILGWQLALAVLAGLLVLLLGLRSSRLPHADLIMAGLLWLLAAGLWLSVPLSVMRNSFYSPMTPPTMQPFPNSDAGYYDSMSQSILIGYPYQGQVPSRPLYIAALAALHLLFGQRYDLIILVQTLGLAFIPVMLYLLGRILHSRAAGVIVALIAVFRELTTLWVSSQTRVSNTKTLLVDLPTLLLLLVACLAVIRWMQRRDSRSAALAGGTFGLLLLLRTQALVVIPVAMLLVVLAYGVRTRLWLAPLIWFAGALFITVAPWLVHNFLVSGRLALDASFQYDIIASQYRYTGNLDIQNVDLQGKSLAGVVLAFALRDPKFVLGFISTHFFATQIGGLLALPLIATFAGLRAPINLYWLDWHGQLTWFNTFLLLFYLALTALGLGAAWKRLKWAGLAPLGFSLGYSLGNGLGRFSGWRYDLPADWIVYFYAGLGVAEVLVLFASLLGADPDHMYADSAPAPARRLRVPAAGLPLALFALVGSMPWLMQGISAPRYDSHASADLVQMVSGAPEIRKLGTDKDMITTFLAQPAATLQIGRVLYPRFFTRDAGLASAHPWPAYAPRGFPRLGFLLLNAHVNDVLLSVRQPPGGLLHGADAIVIGCDATDHVDARLVYIPASGVAFAVAPFNTPCP